MVVVCWLSCWAAWSGWVLPRTCGTGHHVDQAGCGNPPALGVYGHDHLVRGVRDELRDNHHVRQRTPVNPNGRLNRSNPRKALVRALLLLHRDEEAVGSNPATPTPKQQVIPVGAEPVKGSSGGADLSFRFLRQVLGAPS
jgi:hypothetical protein